MPKLNSNIKAVGVLTGLLAVFVVALSLFSYRDRAVWNHVAPHVYEMIGEKGAGGTGFQLLASDGTTLIVTNSHVCELSPKTGENKGLLLVKKNGKSMKRKVLKIDVESDLCIVEAWPVKAGLQLGDPVVEGQRVIAIGHPNLGPLTFVSGTVLSREDVTVM